MVSRMDSCVYSAAPAPVNDITVAACRDAVMKMSAESLRVERAVTAQVVAEWWRHVTIEISLDIVSRVLHLVELFHPGALDEDGCISDWRLDSCVQMMIERIIRRRVKQHPELQLELGYLALVKRLAHPSPDDVHEFYAAEREYAVQMITRRKRVAHTAVCAALRREFGRVPASEIVDVAFVWIQRHPMAGMPLFDVMNDI